MKDFENLDLSGLHLLYEQQLQTLNKKLLAGSSWQDTETERTKLRDISQAINVYISRKSAHPAATQLRSTENS